MKVRVTLKVRLSIIVRVRRGVSVRVRKNSQGCEANVQSHDQEEVKVSFSTGIRVRMRVWCQPGPG